MKKIYGNLIGLKAGQVKHLENLSNHRVPPERIISPRLIGQMSELSHEIRRQVGLLINRSGKVVSVLVGDPNGILLPDTSEYKTPPGRLKGLRYIHTHLKDEKLSREDLTDLTLLRLDLIAAVTLTSAGLPFQVHVGSILPNPTDKTPYQLHPPEDPERLDINCIELIRAIESEMSRISAAHEVASGVEKAILISVTALARHKAEASLEELKELARSCGIYVLDSVIQHRRQSDSRFLMGRGKVEELSIMAMQEGASLIIFDQELNPSQIRSITDTIDLKVIDRTQLILDIFAQRAQTREGKLQVEFAQLKYMLPRLVTKNTAMSRLTGGIGGRGPGETKLEINRRRIRDRITRIEKELKSVRKQRQLQKSRREKKGLPVISIIGYTNAGKSTLLNTLTKSDVLAENRLFATLDPSSKRMRFPRDTEVIITDTVGFIKDLPRELRVAFQATLEELESADLLIHVIDAANPDCRAHMESVDRILEDLSLNRISRLNVLNKQDLTDPDTLAALIRETGGIPVSARRADTIAPLIDAMEQMIGQPFADPAGSFSPRPETASGPAIIC